MALIRRVNQNKLYKMLVDFFNMLFPKYCQMCDQSLEKGEQYICLHCQYDLPVAKYHEQENNVLTNRFAGRVPMKYTLAYLKFTKEGKVQRLLHRLKYKNQPYLGELMGLWYGTELTKAGYQGRFDLIIPIPLHPSKLKKRGYNQSDTFAKGLSASMQIPWYPDAIQKRRANDTQTRKRRFERWENVERVFEVIRPDLVQGKRILIVDDVITTGATLEACAADLLGAGCNEVSIAAIAAAQ